MVGYLTEVFLELHAVVDHGSNLKEIEFSAAVGVDIACEFYLNGALHGFLSHLEYVSEYFWQGPDSVLEDAGKGDYLAVAAFVVAVVDALVYGVVGGTDPL